MNINLFNISFKGIDKSSKNKRNLKQNNDMSLSRYSEMNKHRRNESVVDGFDGNSFRTQEKFGVSYPTPYDFCYEKMSFEKDNDDVVDFFRDSEYEQDKYNRHFDYDADYATSIEDLQYRYHNYSYDDIPLSESLVRSDNGFYETPSFEIDTDIDEESVLHLDFINYRDNIMPAVLKDNNNELWDFASEAAILKRDGYSTQAIARALERCSIGTSSSKQPNVALFSFLVKHPNLRLDVLAKHPSGGEMFDKGFANFYGVFEEYYFNKEKDIKDALNLCKIKDDKVKLVSKELCEIVGLLRHKTAQGIPYKTKPIYSDMDSDRNKYEKYVDKNTPLSQKDLVLIDKLKTNGRLDTDLFDVAKNLLGHKKETVDFTLQSIDKFISRRDEINKLKSTLVSKYPDSLNEPFVNGIIFILSADAKSAIKSTGDLSKQSHLFNKTKKLIKEGFDVQSIAIVLERLQTIQKYSPLNDKLVQEFTTLLKEKKNVGGNFVDEKLADILTKLAIASQQITNIDAEIISLLKENKSKDTELLDLANNMIHRVNDKYKVLEAIKKKLVSDKTPKENAVQKEEPVLPDVVLEKTSNDVVDNKPEMQTVETTEFVNGDIIITKSKGNNVATVIRMPKPKNVISNVDNICIVNGKVVGTSANIIENVYHSDNFNEDVRKNIELARISGKLLAPTRGDVVSGGKIISMIQSNSVDKQMWLDFVDAMLTKGLSNRNILDAMNEKKSSNNASFSIGKMKINHSDNSINNLVQERRSADQIKDVDEQIEKDFVKKQIKDSVSSIASKSNSQESYMSKLIRERLSSQQIKKVDERIDKDSKLAHERNQEALKSLDKKSSITKSDEVKVDEEYVVNRLMNVPSSDKDSAGRIIAKISNANKDEKQILIKLVNNLLNQKHSCYSILMVIASRN